MDCYYSEVSEDLISLGYDTAWGPGDLVLQHLSSLYPNVIIKIEFFEAGNGFGGEEEYKNGKIIKQFYTEDEKKLKELHPESYDLNN